MTKKFISLVLSLALLIGLIPTMSVSAESTVVTHFAEDFETWASGLKFNEDFASWNKATVYFNSAGVSNKTSSSVPNYRFASGSRAKAEVVYMEGYDGEYTNAFRFDIKSDADWDLSPSESNPGGARLEFYPTVALPASDATLVYDFKLFIPEDTQDGVSHDIKKFSFGPIVKVGNSIGDGIKANTAEDYELCAQLSTGWNKITAVMLPYTRNVILYLNDECVGYQKYNHNGDMQNAGKDSMDDALFVNSYKVTDFKEKYIIVDDYNIYSNPDTTTASSIFSDGEDIAANVKPTVEFSQKVLGKVINSDGSVSDCATIEFENMSDGSQVEIASASISEDGKKLTITPAAALKKGVQYTIKVSDVKDMYNQIVEPYEFSFTTEEPEEVVITNAPIFSTVNLGDDSTETISTLQNGLIKATFTFANENDADKDAVIIAVLKDEGEIKAFTYEERTIPAGETLTFNGGFQIDDYANQSIEVYVWDSILSMTPLIEGKYVFDKNSSSWE